MCLLGPVDVVPFDKQISHHSREQNPSAHVCKCANICKGRSAKVLAQVLEQCKSSVGTSDL